MKTGVRSDQGEINRKNREQGSRVEVQFAEAADMDLQLASGGGMVEKEDLIDPKNLGQAKSGRGTGLMVKIVDLERLVQHARDNNRRPVFFLGFEKDGPILMPRKWALVPLEDWKGRFK